MTKVRVATYNVYLGADLTVVFGAQSRQHLREQARLVHRQLLGTDFTARARAIARLLVRERVDVVGLQEVARWSCASLRADGSPGVPEVSSDFLTEDSRRAGAGRRLLRGARRERQLPRRCVDLRRRGAVGAGVQRDPGPVRRRHRGPRVADR